MRRPKENLMCRQNQLLGGCNLPGARKTSAICCVAVIGALLSIMSGPAWSAAEVRGQPDAIQVRAENASTREVLDALSATFKLTYKLPANISREITGLYSGTLHQVLGRILDGNNYIVKVSDNTVEVVILGASGVPAAATSSQVIAKNETPPAPSAPPSNPNVSASAAPTLPASSPPPPLATYLSLNEPATR
jgi:hypothetical protein